MALSSSQIAQMNGSFQQQFMMNQQYAGMIQPPGYNLGGYNTGAQNEGMAGGIMSRSAAIGAPMATLGLGLMGLDPLSMGIRGGMMAHGAGLGVGGSMMAGAAVAAPMMAGMAAIGYMGNQMMSGAQQTQQFNDSMRGSYSFFNPHAAHGRGFSEGGIRQIGGDLRSMAGQNIGGQFGGTADQFQLGPSFAELGRLASSMGRMGLADGVRNAKEFTEKFREMMKSVKTIAEDMGTTLEEAQKTMAAMKGSGIFKNQAGVSHAIRGASVAGGLATTEVTGMMNIGSQISRMFGGTGKQGAMGGIRAIEQVGTALQTGALSEEDIYNATGLTGAEGRRAMAQQNLMQSGSFMRSSKGRWMLASLAGKNGQLDQSSVDDFLAGGMGVGDTRSAAHRNLRGVGRANFIRNEGRLRGAVMEQFGGLAPAMAMMGWAQSRGIDINSMGDREMLFMQRQLGLGRDEADSLIKMTRALPDLLQRQKDAKLDDRFSREHGLRAQNSGIEGIKRKLEAAKDGVNNEMQKVGQDIFNSLTDTIAEWGNRLAGTYEQQGVEGIRELHRAASAGDKSAVKSLIGKGSAGLYGSAGVSGVHEDIGQQRYKEKMEGLKFTAQMATMGQMSAADLSLVTANKDALLGAYSGGLAGLAGEDRMAAFKSTFGKNTDIGRHFRSLDEKGQAAFMQQTEMELGMTKGLLSETMQIPGMPQLVGGGEDHSIAREQERAGRNLLGMQRGAVARGLDTLGKYGGKAMGLSVGVGLTAAGTVGGGLLGFGVGAIPGAYLGMEAGERAQGLVERVLGGAGSMAGDLVERLSGRSGLAQAMGRVTENPEMHKLAYDVLNGEAGAGDRMKRAKMGIMGAAAERGGMDKLTEDEKAQLGVLDTFQMAADVNNLINSKPGGVNGLTDADWAPLIARHKKTLGALGLPTDKIGKEDVLASTAAVGAQAKQDWQRRVNEISKQVKETTLEDTRTLTAGGVPGGGVAELRKYTGVGAGKGKFGEAGYEPAQRWSIEKLELTRDTEKSLRASGGEGAVQAARAALAVQDAGRALSEAKSPEEKAAALEGYYKSRGSERESLRGLDVKGLRSIASKFAGSETGDIARGMVMRGQSLIAGKRRKGAFGAIADQLGEHLEADELAAMKGKSPEEQAMYLARKKGVQGDESFVQSLASAIGTTSLKGGEIKGADILSVAKLSASKDTQEKLAAADKSKQGPQEKIIDELKTSNEHLKVIADGVKPTQAALASIKFSADPEKDKSK